ncbi:hypothetical protein Rs2_29746 [Raphanus sativus]|nr:hypothetical protein Rs2_29746 [Raphanus sativus]
MLSDGVRSKGILRDSAPSRIYNGLYVYPGSSFVSRSNLLPDQFTASDLTFRHVSSYLKLDAIFFLSLLPIFHIVLDDLMADDEVVDPKKYLEESCKPKCVKPLLEYQACVKRIQGDDSGHKHCTGQYFDYWHCIDKCVAPKLFAKLK